MVLITDAVEQYKKAIDNYENIIDACKTQNQEMEELKKQIHSKNQETEELKKLIDSKNQESTQNTVTIICAVIIVLLFTYFLFNKR